MQEAPAQFCEIDLLRLLGVARRSLEEAITRFGLDKKVCFPGTDYHLPLINSFLKIEVESLSDLRLVLDRIGQQKPAVYQKVFLNEWILFLLFQEVFASLAALDKRHPLGGCGFLPDSILRDLSLRIIDGRISGVAIILGMEKNNILAFNLLRDFHSKKIICLLAGGINGDTLAGELENYGLKLGIKNNILALGSDYLSSVYAFNFLIRIPLIYGNSQAGEVNRIKDYLHKHIPAFTLILGERKELSLGAALGGLAFGIPVISDSESPVLDKIDSEFPGSQIITGDYQDIPAKCIQACGIKIKDLGLGIPIAYSDLFEGERIRKGSGFEFGGKPGLSCELLSCKDKEDIEDGKVELIGPDIDQGMLKTDFLHLALIVEVSGRKMQKDLEPVLERQLHRFINYASGVMHEGQRDMNSIKISYNSFLKGFRLRHIGLIIYYMLHKEYGEIIEKAQVKIYTRREDIKKLLVSARKVFSLRDKRLKGMVDERVDTYYSCLICQSFVPNHICIITPQRPGMCGAYSWLDAKISSEIIPNGWSNPILKGNCLNRLSGQWDNIDRFMETKTNKAVKKVSLYSLMDYPQSSSSLFECIVAVIPEANGVMIVDRNHTGMTPLGMDFSSLSDVTKGIPAACGFMGISKGYILSNKFILAEGGLKRLVWMPKTLKQSLGRNLIRLSRNIGEPGLPKQIADEEVATTSDALLSFLKRVRHPALSMNPIVV